MKIHRVTPVEPPRSLPRQEELAWKIAELAHADWPIDEEVSAEVINRVIDIAGVAAAGYARSPVAAARAQALAHPRRDGATLFGMSSSVRVHCEWAAWANCAAVRELDFHDNFFALEACHPGDAIPVMLAVAQQLRLAGSDLIRGVCTAYEVQIALAKGIPLNRFGIDHVGHLGPAIAAGIGAMLRLSIDVIYQAVQSTAHLSASTRQTRKGVISSWKAQAPGHVAQVAIIAIDRAMRGETSPSPIYEGGFGLVSVLLGGRDAVYPVPLPDRSDGMRGILETYTKEHSAAYHGQAAIDLALRIRPEIVDLEAIESIVIHTHRAAHVGMGSGSGDREKWDPGASRETLDHSLMFIFCVALQDGIWHHERSYAPERVQRADTVCLWQKIRTAEDPDWNERYYRSESLEKEHGFRAVITFHDGRELTKEIRVANAHPRGASPFSREQYLRKFTLLTENLLQQGEVARFIEIVERLPALQPDDLVAMNFTIRPDFHPKSDQHRRGIFDRRSPSREPPSSELPNYP